MIADLRPRFVLDVAGGVGRSGSVRWRCDASGVSRQFAKAERDMARCSLCDHDLYCYPERLGKATNAFVYCTNKKCKHHRKAHPTGKELNRGKYKDAAET